jgi:hypothetical protein
VYGLLAVMCTLSLSSPVVPQSVAGKYGCKPLTFPAGSEGDVVAMATAFLAKAESIQAHPYWPGGDSGVTLGIGWDLGYHTQDEVESVWGELGPEKLGRLKTAAQKKGVQAETLLLALKSIDVPTDLSRRVLAGSLLDYYSHVIRVFPGLDRMPAEAQVVFVSLVFNRGEAMGHEPSWAIAKEVDRRWEFRELRDDVKRQDMFAIYAHLGTMKRLWETSGPRGLRIRRRDEQALIRPYVDKQLDWEKKCNLPNGTSNLAKP